MTLRLPTTAKVLLLCVCLASAGWAQQSSAAGPQVATIMGTVLDVTGGIVPNATVVLKNSGGDSKAERRTVAQGDGSFRFDGVKPGVPWQVSITAQGFAPWASKDITVAPGQLFPVAGISLRVAPAEVTVNVEPLEQLQVEQVKQEESQRILSVIPNFYVVYGPNAVPLTPKLKFRLAFRTLVDPVTIAGFGINAAIYQATDYPSYQLGAKGYFQRLGATFAGGYTNVLVGDAIMPSLLHQDPRYFYQGTGTKKSRLWHAMITGFVTRADDGHREFAWSDLSGDLASGAIANAYYPRKDRGPGLVLSSAAIGAGGRVVNAMFQEFVLHKLTSSRAAEKSAAATSNAASAER